MLIENSSFTILQPYSKQTLQFDNLLLLMHLNESSLYYLPAKNEKLGHFWRILFLITVVLAILLFMTKGWFSLTFFDQRRQFQEINLLSA